MTEIENAIEIVTKQEELLWFDHFSAEDAFDLGCFMVNR